MEEKKNLSASAEDYLEAIYILCNANGVARSKEIMERLGVSGPSVTEALQNLGKKGLVNYSPYEAITLTSQGEEIARDVYHRHSTLKDFFINVLGVDPVIADEGACKMEHAATSEIINRLVLYTKYLKDVCEPARSDNFLSFQDFLKADSPEK